MAMLIWCAHIFPDGEKFRPSARVVVSSTHLVGRKFSLSAVIVA
jgi:hypothetical protein